MAFFCSGRVVAKCFDMATLWKRYAKSMRRRRPGSELDHNSFGRHCRKSYAFMAEDGSIVFGQLRDEVFFISHFCPASRRGGANLLKELSRNGRMSVVAAVTADLIKMLEKCGFSNTGMKVPQWFRGAEVEKFILVVGDQDKLRSLI